MSAPMSGADVLTLDDAASLADLGRYAHRAKALDDEVAARRGTSYAGEADPYKKPREIVVATDDDDTDDDTDEDAPEDDEDA